MEDNLGHPDLSESVQELKSKLEAMKRIIDSNEVNGVNEGQRRKWRNMATCRASIIDGNFLSIVFVIVLSLILIVAFYAFFNLFIALKKKYTGQHSEL